MRIQLGFLALAAFLLGTAISASARESKKEEAERYIKVLKSSKDSKARIEAFTGLGTLSQVQVSLGLPAVPMYIEGLKDKDAKVRKAAAEGYGKIDLEDKTEQIKSLVDLLKNDKDDNVKEGAVRGLGAIGSAAKDAVPAIKDAQKAAQEKSMAKKAPNYYRDALMQINGGKKN